MDSFKKNELKKIRVFVDVYYLIFGIFTVNFKISWLFHENLSIFKN